MRDDRDTVAQNVRMLCLVLIAVAATFADLKEVGHFSVNCFLFISAAAGEPMAATVTERAVLLNAVGRFVLTC
jgi:hypothetical protein